MSNLSENNTFQVSNNDHDDRNNYQIIYYFIKNARKTINNTVMMKIDELTFIYIKN